MTRPGSGSGSGAAPGGRGASGARRPAYFLMGDVARARPDLKRAVELLPPDDELVRLARSLLLQTGGGDEGR